ncbi:hypothetical protein D9757_013860 [Collybiopsis confluens]|uniref:NACHT domain-containing protein n=1 Tax=Collybiopsis confluens TaxID=2823264 RepID=A0A8H5FYV2_9AGAR|nr:hypothetical protein D9757_013860 [Collybiopsis confluens]
MSSVSAFDGFRNATFTGGEFNTVGGNLHITKNYSGNPPENIHETIKARLSQKLKHIANAHVRTEKVCLEDTRVNIIREISQWILKVDERNPAQICILYGAAGTGKSAICHTIGKRVMDSGELGAFFCFDRNFLAERTPVRALHTIAYDLGQKSPEFGAALLNIIEKEQYLCNSSDVEELWKKLIAKPAGMVDQTRPLIIVIDALDEMGKEGSREMEEKFLSLFLNEGSNLPNNIHILVTSRPESTINEYINLYGLGVWTQDMSDLGKTEEDIKTYVSRRMKFKLDARKCDILAQKAGGYFQWAYTACEALLERKPEIKFESQFKQILSLSCGQNGNLFPLDTLYRSILESIFNFQNVSIMAEYRTIMSLIFAAYQPLSRKSVVELQSAYKRHKQYDKDEDEDDNDEAVLQYLGSLFSGVDNMSTPVQPVHISVRDFLLDEGRSKEYFIDPMEGKRLMAMGTIKVMTEQLHFNMCKLESSHVYNSEVKDLKEKIEENISPVLEYACCWWGNHVYDADFELDSLYVIEHFFNEFSLYWIEVLSLLDLVGLIPKIINKITEWANQEKERISSHHHNFLIIGREILNWIQMFGRMFGESTPHIYLSGLPFIPKKSILQKIYCPRFKTLAELCSGHQSHWPILQTVLMRHEGGIYTVAFSHDGERIVSGSFDSTVRIWNAQTGEEKGKPLKGHTDAVTSVAFSPDGMKIVSGSYDDTVRIWNAQTGEEQGKPLEGHTDWVTSVAFSPNGMEIVSGSYDKTVRIWNAQTGEKQGKLRGHTDRVTSVAFSPDGMKIVSGSFDRTVRIWNAQTGEEQGKPLEGHTDVTSVAFSPDGMKIISGSYDKTVRIWNAQTGEEQGKPLEGHTDWVTSVAFSPDGMKIVSGSYDSTVRIWNAQTGQQEGKPLEEHTDWVTPVAFSPNGMEIVSGSYDSTMGIWNAQTGQQEGKPLEEHTDWVTPVAFSPNGMEIVSGSYDSTMGIWNAQTGQQEGKPLEEHTDRVTSVAFSPNGMEIVSGSYDSTVRIWNAQTVEQEEKPLEGHTDRVTSVAFSPNGMEIVSGSYDKTVRIWDAHIGTEQVNGHSGSVEAVPFSPDGTYIASESHDSLLRISEGSLFTLSFCPQHLKHNLHHSNSSFQHVSLQPDGWIHGLDSSLFLWIPAQYFNGLMMPHMKLLMSSEQPTSLNLSRFVHGKHWHHCYTA